MKDRTTPVCHRTIGPNVPALIRTQGYPAWPIETAWMQFRPEPHPCVGSACSAWEGHHVGVYQSDERRYLGIGVCSEYPDAEPWPDPAMKSEGDQ